MDRDLELIPEEGDGDQIGRRNFIGNVLLSGLLRPQEIVILERSKIEKENDQAMVAHRCVDILRLGRRKSAHRHDNGKDARDVRVFPRLRCRYIRKKRSFALDSSSVTENCSGFKPVIGLPDLSVTRTSISTKSTVERIVPFEDKGTVTAGAAGFAGPWRALTGSVGPAAQRVAPGSRARRLK